MKSGERSDKKAPNSNLDLNFSASSPVESTVLIINVFLSKTIIIIVLGKLEYALSKDGYYNS